MTPHEYEPSDQYRPMHTDRCAAYAANPRMQQCTPDLLLPTRRKKNMSTHQEIAQVLNKAADWLEANKLMKGVFYDTWNPERPPTAACVRGAIYIATDSRMGVFGSRELSIAAQKSLQEYLAPQLQKYDSPVASHYACIALWNNASSRTKEEVVEALRAAAVIEQSKSEQLAFA